MRKNSTLLRTATQKIKNGTKNFVNSAANVFQTRPAEVANSTTSLQPSLSVAPPISGNMMRMQK